MQNITAREEYEQSTMTYMCENVMMNHIKSHYFVHLREDQLNIKRADGIMIKNWHLI